MAFPKVFRSLQAYLAQKSALLHFFGNRMYKTALLTVVFEPRYGLIKLKGAYTTRASGMDFVSEHERGLSAVQSALRSQIKR